MRVESTFQNLEKPTLEKMKLSVFKFLLILVYKIHYSTSSSAPSDNYREFLFDNYSNHTLSLPFGLDNSTQVTIKVSDKMDCVFSCTQNIRWCKSVNFKIQSENDGLHICELLSTDKYTKPKYLISAQGFTHLSIKNKCMDPSPCQNNGSCYPDYDYGDFHCICNGTKGRNCEIFYQDCSKLLSAGYTADGVYQIDPDGQGSFQVYCDMTTDGGGWTVFQNNPNGSVGFNRGWQDYKTGFGNPNGEFWLGLDKIYRLTKRQITMLRVDLEDLNGNKRYAVYSSFAIADESDFYRLSVSGYSGTAGNSLMSASNPDWICNNRRFSTPDKDNDARPGGNCASKGGWWYGWCSISDLNGDKTWWSFSQTLKSTEMKLK